MQNSPPVRCVIACSGMLALLLVPLSGCAKPIWPFASTDTNRETRPPHPSSAMTWKEAAGANETVRVVHLVFEVQRIDIPLKGIRHSRKIWNHVDELRVEADQSARLVRNGMRIGVGSAEAWPAISTILRASDARSHEEKLFAQSGIPVTLVVDTIREPESVFAYTRSGSLVGKTFPGGEKLVTLDFAFRPELGGYTDLQVHFEIRHDSGETNWERREGVIREVPEIERFVFSELGAGLTLRPDEFLIIGPSEKADHNYLVGGCFFSSPGGEQPSETLFCIRPKPYQSQETRRQTS